MAATYKNGFYSPLAYERRVEITTESKPLQYEGFEIFKRGEMWFDIVYLGVCVSNCAGIRGAKRVIDCDHERLKSMALILTDEKR